MNRLQHQYRKSSMTGSFYIIILLLFSSPIVGQEDLASIHLSKAKGLFNEKKFEEFKLEIERAADLFSQSKQWDSLYSCQVLLYQCATKLDNFKEIYLHLESIGKKIPSSSSNYAYGKSEYILGYVNSKMGNTQNTIFHYQNALQSLLYNKDNIRYSGALGNLADEFTKLGNYYSAIPYKKKAVLLAKDQKGNFTNYLRHLKGLAYSYFYKDDITNAKKYFLDVQGLQTSDNGEIDLALSKTENRLGEFSEALKLLDKASRKMMDDDESKAHINMHKANILNNMGKTGDAIDLYKSVENIVLKNSDKREIGKFLYSFGKLYADDLQIDRALNYLNESLKLFTTYNLSQFDQIEENSYLYNEIWIGDIFATAGNLYFQKFLRNKDQTSLDTATIHYDFAIKSLDNKRDMMGEFDGVNNLTTKSKSIYEDAISTYFILYEKSSDDSYLQKALNISQRHNAFILRNQLKEKSILDIINIATHEKQEYLSKKQKYLHQASLLNTSYSDAMFEKYIISREEFDKIKSELSERHEKFNLLNSDQSTIELDEIQKTLDKKTRIVKYFVGKERMFIFIISQTGLKCVSTEIESNLRSTIVQYRDLLANYNSKKNGSENIEKSFLETSFSIYETVIQPVIDSIPNSTENLIIIPTGILVQIPFESLVVKKSKDWSDPNAYLLSKYNISYTYFCGQLTHKVDKKIIRDITTYGLEYDEFTLDFMKRSLTDSITNVSTQKFRSSDLTPLYFADDEALEISNLFDGKAYTNQNATLANFMRGVPNSDIIHISAHSFVDSELPENSSIIFNKTDSTTNNLLLLKDIYKLEIDCELVTLSACNTFYGPELEGEGLISMARAFTESGSQSVLGSFWSIPDEISSIFMRLFYTKLKEGKSKSQALREAKLEYLTNDEISNPFYRSPAYWSSWVLFGKTDPIHISSDGISYWVLILSVLAILLLLSLFNNLRKTALKA